MHIWWILYEWKFPCFLARKWWVNKLLLLKPIGKWRDICNSNHNVYFLFIECDYKDVEHILRGVVLDCQQQQRPQKHAKLSSLPASDEWKNYICFQCCYVDSVVFNAAYREYFTRIALHAVIFEKFLMATDFFLLCAFQKTHHPNTNIIPAITRDFHSFYAENVIAKHKEWCSVNTTVNSMLRLHFYF